MIKDNVKKMNGSLFIHFQATGTTGKFSVLPLHGHGFTFYREKESVYARLSTTDAPVLIEQFQTEHQAEQGLIWLKANVISHLRLSRLTSSAKAAMKWVVFPLFIFLAALAVNSALTLRNMPPIQQPYIPSAMQALPPETPQEKPEEIAEALAKGASMGLYSVPLSAGEGGTIYVFSDPQCPHCRTLEKELHTLNGQLSIHVFPVSVIGGDVSARLTESVLCTPEAKRKDAWNAAINGAIPSPQSCEEGQQAVKTNNIVFAKANMTGTPTIIRKDGTLLPASAPHTAEAIAAWAAGNK